MIANRIRQGRKLRRKSLRDLGRAIGRSHEAVRQYEEGHIEVDSGLLLEISEALALPIEFFLRPEYLSSASVPAYRSHPSISETERHAVAAEASEVVERYLQVALLANAHVVHSPPPGFPINVSSFDAVEDAADALRKAWQLGFDPLGPLIPLLEERGIPVVELTSSPNFDACTIEFDSPHGHGWVIAVRPGVVGDRLRFSLAHELGHLFLIPDGMDAERAANRFAAAFIVPRWAVGAELGERRSKLNLQELYSLKHRYGLSMQSWIHRAVELGIVSEGHGRHLRTALDEIEGPRKEPGAEIATERPKRLFQLLEKLVAEDIVSDRRAAELSGLSFEEWQRRHETFFL